LKAIWGKFGEPTFRTSGGGVTEMLANFLPKENGLELAVNCRQNGQSCREAGWYFKGEEKLSISQFKRTEVNLKVFWTKNEFSESTAELAWMCHNRTMTELIEREKGRDKLLEKKAAKETGI
jgi:hypothetical protein